MIYLFDADIYAYRAAKLSEQEIDWGNGVSTHEGDLEEAKGRMETSIAEDLEKLGASEDDLELIFSGGDNWRKRENPQYKSNRTQAKPLVYQNLVEWAMDRYLSNHEHGMEADDLLGWRATSTDENCVVSIDKDMNTLPAWVFNPDKDDAPRKITKSQADYFFWLQTITGDPTDGYGGARGVGEKGAKRLLAEFFGRVDERTLWNEIVKLYESRDQTEADAIMNARMARICRYGEWDFTERTLTWQPPEV